MYVEDVEDLYDKARTYFGLRGGPLSYDSRENRVRVLLYGTQIFYLRIELGPMYTGSMSFAHEVSAGIVNQTFLGTELALVENTQADVEAAFDVIDQYARLLLPDKFLKAYDALGPDDERP